MNLATVAPPPAQPPLPQSVVTGASPRAVDGPKPYRWTIAAYRELDETDLFRGVRTMLIRGEIFVMPAPKPPHDVSLGLADDWLRSVFASGHHVRNQMGFDVGTDNDPSPDLAVVVGSRRDYGNRTPTAAVLVVEVSSTSLYFDTTTKAELYAAAGVPDYWVIDLESRRLLVFRDPVPMPVELGGTPYRTHLTLGPDETVAPLAAPTSVIAVAELLP